VVNLVGRRTALTSTQKIPEFAVNERIVLQPNTYYTCPAGKKAICKGTVVCTGTGAGAQGRFSVAGVIMFRWVVAGASPTNIAIPKDASILTGAGGGVVFPYVETIQSFDVELEAGDTIETSQDSGTNAEFNVFMKVQETSI